MSAVALLKRAKDAGVTLWINGDAIHYRGPRDALAWLVPQLKAHKLAILAAFVCPRPSGRVPDPPVRGGLGGQSRPARSR